MGRSIGIDLGTTNSCMAILDDDQATILANSEGSRTTPSVVAFADDGTVIVGDTAKRQTAVNVDRTFSSIKRHIGTDWTTQPVDGKRLRAQEISARVLQKLKKDAETYLNEEVTDVVITVPAYFDDAQRQATIEAGKIAGLNVLRIINEPTAAAVAYGLDKSKEDEIILVFDLGGGTFDVSLLEVGKADGFSTIQVRSTSGDNELGGDDWDSQIVEWMKNSIAEEFGNGVEYDAAAEVRLKEAAEQAKKDLSNSTTAKISLQYLGSVGNTPCHFDGTLSRDEFEMITADLLDRCRFPFEDAIKEAGLDVSDINHVVLVGGSTRMPAVTELVKELTGGKEPNKGVNPDEVVAAGAALQSGVLTNKKKDLLLIDVTPLSLGVETAGGVMNVMIAKNSAIPTSAREVFSTAEDDQDSVEVQVFQGERRLTRDNKHLGTFELTGIPPASRGAPKIEVTFELDANGIVHVSAVDLGTGVKQDTTITGGSALSDTEIKRMIADAEEHSAEDEQEVESLQNLQKAKTLTYTVKKSLDKHEDLPEDIESEVKERLAGLEDAIAGKDPDLIREASDALTISQRRIGEWIYGKR